jgi:hypothetical protein
MCGNVVKEVGDDLLGVDIPTAPELRIPERAAEAPDAPKIQSSAALRRATSAAAAARKRSNARSSLRIDLSPERSASAGVPTLGAK